eukprot:331569_1
MSFPMLCIIVDVNRCQCHGSTGNGQWCGAALGRLMPFDGCFVLLQRVVVIEQEYVLWFRCSKWLLIISQWRFLWILIGKDGDHMLFIPVRVGTKRLSKQHQQKKKRYE